MKLSQALKTDDQGNVFFPVDPDPEDSLLIEVTLNPRTHEVVDFYINRIRIVQDDLVVELADRYDNGQIQAWYRDYLYDEAGREEEIEASRHFALCESRGIRRAS